MDTSTMLKLIAPFRALFSLDSSLIAARPSYFTEFLRQVEKELKNPESGINKKIQPALDVTVNVPVETNDSEIGSRYISLNTSGSFYLSPRIFTLRFKPDAAHDLGAICNHAMTMADEVSGKYSGTFLPDINSLRVD